MIISINYKTREDGVNLIQRYSGEILEDGTVLRTNFMLHKIGTDEYYADPIDVEDAPWEYEETDIPIDFYDERMTTMVAYRFLGETGTHGKKRKDAVDTLSAEIILQNYIDRERTMKRKEN